MTIPFFCISLARLRPLKDALPEAVAASTSPGSAFFVWRVPSAKPIFLVPIPEKGEVILREDLRLCGDAVRIVDGEEALLPSLKDLMAVMVPRIAVVLIVQDPERPAGREHQLGSFSQVQVARYAGWVPCSERATEQPSDVLFSIDLRYTDRRVSRLAN